jgi:hypothetical protein
MPCRHRPVAVFAEGWPERARRTCPRVRIRSPQLLGGGQRGDGGVSHPYDVRRGPCNCCCQMVVLSSEHKRPRQELRPNGPVTNGQGGKMNAAWSLFCDAFLLFPLCLLLYFVLFLFRCRFNQELVFRKNCNIACSTVEKERGYCHVCASCLKLIEQILFESMATLHPDLQGT